ncbi:MAG: serine/threonine-protein kinase HipA [Bradymonadia bacterium]
MKFDGISNNRDKEIADPQGYGCIEFAYYLMVRKAGIDMTPCRLHEEGGRAHFMTRRFDRTASGGKRHMQSLGSIAHFDYNQPAAYSYEQAIDVIRRLRLPFPAIAAQVRRAIFNVVGRNQDDHVKNIAFLMNRRGEWSLSPAFDVSFNWNPSGAWTGKHQMSLRGKRDDFESDDLLEFALWAGVKKAAAKRMLDEVYDAVRAWPRFAEEAGVTADAIKRIAALHRLP